MLEKFQFWKKHEGLDLPDEPGGLPTSDWKMPAMPDAPTPFSDPSSFAPPDRPSATFPQAHTRSENRDLEIIEAKLDTIKSMVEGISQRLANLEQMAKE